MQWSLDPEIGQERYKINRAVTEKKYGVWTEPYEDHATTSRGSTNDWAEQWQNAESVEEGECRSPSQCHRTNTNKKTDDIEFQEARKIQGCLVQ